MGREVTPELQHSLQDAYTELRGLQDHLRQRIQEIMGDPAGADKLHETIRELQSLADWVSHPRQRVAYVLVQIDPAMKRIYPELSDY